MAMVFVIVDDAEDGETNLARNLKLGIEELTNGAYTAELILEVDLATAVTHVVRRVNSIVKKGEDTVQGILVDLVQQKINTKAGATLLEAIKRHPRIGHLDVVVYTSTNVEAERAKLRAAGAKAVVKRDLRSGMPPHIQLARDILKAFGVKL